MIEDKQVTKILRVGFGYKAPTEYELENDKDVSEFEEQHRQHKALVKEILECWKPATNSDALLYLEYLRTKFSSIEVTSGKDNIIFKIPREIIKKLVSPESITRARRSLNNLGIGLPTNPAIIIKRKRREKAIKKYFGDKNG